MNEKQPSDSDKPASVAEGSSSGVLGESTFFSSPEVRLRNISDGRLENNLLSSEVRKEEAGTPPVQSWMWEGRRLGLVDIKARLHSLTPY